MFPIRQQSSIKEEDLVHPLSAFSLQTYAVYSSCVPPMPQFINFMTQFPIYHQQLQAVLEVSRVNRRTMGCLVSTFDPIFFSP